MNTQCESVPAPQPLPIKTTRFPIWPRTIENRAALRTACAALTAVLISFSLHLQTPYWSGMSVVIVSNLYTGSIIDKAMMRILGTIAGAFLGYFIAGLVVNSVTLYFLSCFLIIAIAVYYYHISHYAYAYLLGALCAFIVIAQLALSPTNAFFVAIWRPVEIAIGVLVASISAYSVFPNHLQDNILDQVSDIFMDFRELYRHLKGNLMQGQMDTVFLIQANQNIKKKLQKAIELISALNREIGVTKEYTDELRALLNSFYTLSRQVHYLLLVPLKPDDLKDIHKLPLEAIFLALDHDLDLLEALFRHNDLKPGLLSTPETLNIKKQVYKNDFSYTFVQFLNQINQNFILMQALLKGENTKGLLPGQSKKSWQLVTKQERLRTDLDLVKHGIKAGLAVVLALAFWMVSNWPGGINGIISSLLISIRKNLYEMKNISIHRILGCFLGGGVALSSLAIFEMNLYDFIIVLFFSVWGFTWFMFKFPKYSYIGLQANIALIIALAQEGGPPVLLDPPLQRLGGIIIGIVSSFLVANILWRTNVWTLLNRYIIKLQRYLLKNVHQVLLGSKEVISIYDMSTLFWTTRGLIETLSDEKLNKTKTALLYDQRQKFESLVVLQAIISHILISIDRNKAYETATLLEIDLRSYAKKILICYENEDEIASKKLSEELHNILTGLSQKLINEHISLDDANNLISYINALLQLLDYRMISGQPHTSFR